jgi:hypothetical protein
LFVSERERFCWAMDRFWLGKCETVFACTASCQGNPYPLTVTLP